MLKLGAVRRSMGVTGARYVILNVFRTRAGRHKRDLLEIQCDNISAVHTPSTYPLRPPHSDPTHRTRWQT
jgi:hypothetical protein